MQCQVCHKQESKYKCPKCYTSYCNIECYKQHGAQCTEAFYRQHVEQEMHLREKEDGEMDRKTVQLLVNQYACGNQTEMSQETEQQLHLGQRLAILLDTDIENVENRLSELQVEDILKIMTKDERKQFQNMAFSGSLNTVIQLSQVVPWWETDVLEYETNVQNWLHGPKIIELNQEYTTVSHDTPRNFPSVWQNRERMTHIKNTFESSNLESIGAPKKISTYFPFHILCVLYGYAYVYRRFNGVMLDPNDETVGVEAASMLIDMSPTLHDTSYQIESFEQCLNVFKTKLASHETQIENDNEVSTHTKEDVTVFSMVVRDTKTLLLHPRVLAIDALLDAWNLVDCLPKANRKATRNIARKLWFMAVWMKQESQMAGVFFHSFVCDSVNQR